VRTIRNTQIQSVGITQSFVVHIVTGVVSRTADVNSAYEKTSQRELGGQLPVESCAADIDMFASCCGVLCLESHVRPVR
jgi:hypothetical protein